MQNERLCFTIFNMVLTGIMFLHYHCHTAHMDIKLDNLMFDSDFDAKIIDFGLSRSVFIPISGISGTIQTASPEMHLDGLYAPAVADMY